MVPSYFCMERSCRCGWRSCKRIFGVWRFKHWVDFGIDVCLGILIGSIRYVMEEARGSSSSLPPFIAKTYEMVDEPSTDPIVSWSQSNNSFVVWNPPEFSGELLPRFFKHNNFSSFIRQLNTYGFRKIDPEHWEFANEDFIRGQPHLLKNIHRRKPVHSHSMHTLQDQAASSSPLTESERQGYRDTVDRLKSEKGSLHSELDKHREERVEIKLQAQALAVHFQSVEKRQKEILSFLGKTLLKPALELDFTPHSESQDRKRRLSANSFLYYDEITENHDQLGENSVDASNLERSKEVLDRLESSLTLWENMLSGIGNSSLQKSSSSPLDESTSCADSPAISYMQLNADVGSSRTSGIDMNLKPDSSAAAASNEQQGGTSANAQTGVNDVFWEQFLTENPGSTNNASQVQPERRGVKNENKAVDRGKFWWNVGTVNYRAEQLGQLTPAEKT